MDVAPGLEGGDGGKMNITQINHTPVPDTVASLLARVRDLDQRWAEEGHRLKSVMREYDAAGVEIVACVASVSRIIECRRQLREALLGEK